MEIGKNAYMFGKGFVCDIDVDWWTNSAGQYKACANIGEEYYESDPYKSKDLALCEIKGWLEGIRAKIDGTIKNLGV